MTQRRRPTTIWRTLQTPDGTRPGPRERRREARNYAELWYQALREWRVVESDRVKVYYGPAKTSRMRVVGVGSGSSGGQSGSYWATITQVITPHGSVSESAIAALCNADPFLSRIRAGLALASLIDERGGWASPKGPAVVYALAVLTLATRLGDTRAETHLPQLQKSGD